MAENSEKLVGPEAFRKNLWRFKSPSALRTYYGIDEKAGAELWKSKIQPPEDAFYTFTVNIGGRASGKTYVMLGTALAFLLANPGTEAIIVRRHWNELFNSIVKDLKRVAYEFIAGTSYEEDRVNDRELWEYRCNELLPQLIDGPHRREGYWDAKIPLTGSRLVIKPEPEKATDREIEDAFKGPQYGLVILDELTQLKKITFSTLQDNLRQPGIKHPRLIACTNPPVKGHWVYKLARDQEERILRGERPAINVIRSHMDENPFMDPGYKERMKEKYKDEPMLYAMYIEGQDGLSMEGTPVFKNSFSLDRNCSNLLFSPHAPLCVGMDFGWTANAAVFGQVTDRGHFNVLGELFLEQTTLETFANECRTYMQRRFPGAKEVQWFGDPNSAVQTNVAVGLTTAAILRDLGIRLRWIKRPVELGLNNLKTLMTDHGLDGKRPRLQVDAKHCEELRMGLLAGYVYKEHGGVMKPEPRKDGHYDHIMDALRYLADNLFAGRAQRKSTAPAIVPGSDRRRR